MFDFVRVNKTLRNGRYYYKPTFIVKSSAKDIMTRGGDFYAFYDETTGLWNRSKSKMFEIIDIQVREYAEKDKNPEYGIVVVEMADSANELSTQFKRFCDSMGDHWVGLDQKMVFSNTEVKRTDYATKTLDYPLQECPTPYYEALTDVLYLPDEREKWEWAVGCMIAGDQRKIQKMFAFYGEPGTGKSTIIGKIIADMIMGGYEMGYASAIATLLFLASMGLNKLIQRIIGKLGD